MELEGIGFIPLSELVTNEMACLEDHAISGKL